jgi:hypothetical protein
MRSEAVSLFCWSGAQSELQKNKLGKQEQEEKLKIQRKVKSCINSLDTLLVLSESHLPILFFGAGLFVIFFISIVNYLALFTMENPLTVQGMFGMYLPISAEALPTWHQELLTASTSKKRQRLSTSSKRKVYQVSYY